MDTPLEEIRTMCEGRYRYCMIRCLNPRYNGSSPAGLIQDARNFINAVEHKFRSLHNQPQDDKPLPSVILTRRRLGFLYELRERLNILESDCAVMEAERFSDKKKKEILGFNVTYDPRRYAKAVAIRPIDTGAALSSLQKMLEVYRSGDASPDAGNLVCNISLVAQDDILADAAACEGIQDELLQQESIAGLLNLVPLVGRLVKLVFTPNLLNPYAQWVELDRIVRFASTDALRSSHGVIQESDALILGGGSMAGLHYFSTSQSFLLLQNPDCSHADSLIAGAYLWLAALLTFQSPLPEWVHEELGMVRRLVATQLSAWWMSYRDHVAGDQFFQCLVTEGYDALIFKYLRCPHPGKFLVALWYEIASGKRFTPDELKKRLFAVSVEILGRAGASWKPANFLSLKDFSMEAFMESAWRETKCLDLPYSKEKTMNIFTSEVRLRLTNDPACKHPRFEFDMGKAKEINYYKLSITVVEMVFAHLATLCGHQECGLSEADMDAALGIASIVNSKERCETAGKWTGDHGDQMAALYHEKNATSVISSLLDQATHKARLYCSNEYDANLLNNHEHVPWQIKAEHMERYEAETGRGIAKDFMVNPVTGLSGNACCFSDCCYFLKRTKVSQFKSHLKEALGDYVPGLHTTMFLDKGRMEIIDGIHKGDRVAVSRMTAMIEEGGDLKEPLLFKKERRAIDSAREEERGKAEQALVQQKKKAMHDGITRLLDKMAPEFLECVVMSIVDEYKKEQPYEEFKALFDRAYGV